MPGRNRFGRLRGGATLPAFQQKRQEFGVADAKDGGRGILFYYELHFIRHRTPKAFLLENVEETWGAWLSDLRRDGRSWRQRTMASHSADTGYTLLASGKTSIMDRLLLWTVCFPGSRCASAVGNVLGRTCLHVNDRSWGDALAHIGSVLSHARRVGI